MTYKIVRPGKSVSGKINLTASKSESNRALIIQALCKDSFTIHNLAAAQDTQTLARIIKEKDSASSFDVGPAGTTMRYLTAYFATLPGKRVLTGTERMQNRPIGILVEALRQLGADISYLGKEGYPPLEINGRSLTGNEVTVDATVSSQFVSALLLIAPRLGHGLRINLEGNAVSHPYINMTLKIMEQFGVYGQWNETGISVSNQQYTTSERETPDFTVEADWSAASYWYAIAALSEDVDLEITGLRQQSLQGDSVLPHLFNFFGVKTEFTDSGIRLTKGKVLARTFGFDFSDCPDIAQTVAVVTAALNIPAVFNGIKTLGIKETDRLKAMTDELGKFGVTVESDELSMTLKPGESLSGKCVSVATHEDHRIAMSFAPLALVCEGGVEVQDPDVVGKSYPGFWDDLKAVGFTVEKKV